MSLLAPLELSQSIFFLILLFLTIWLLSDAYVVVLDCLDHKLDDNVDHLTPIEDVIHGPLSNVIFAMIIIKLSKINVLWSIAQT